MSDVTDTDVESAGGSHRSRRRHRGARRRWQADSSSENLESSGDETGTTNTERDSLSDQVNLRTGYACVDLAVYLVLVGPSVLSPS